MNLVWYTLSFPLIFKKKREKEKEIGIIGIINVSICHYNRKKTLS